MTASSCSLRAAGISTARIARRNATCGHDKGCSACEKSGQRSVKARSLVKTSIAPVKKRLLVRIQRPSGGSCQRDVYVILKSGDVKSGILRCCSKKEGW